MRTRFISRIKYLLFLLCLSVSADIFRGITERQHIWRGSILVENGYVGDDLVFTNHTGPTITSVSANPTSIDLDTNPRGIIELSVNLTGTVTDVAFRSNPDYFGGEALLGLKDSPGWRGYSKNNPAYGTFNGPSQTVSYTHLTLPTTPYV